MLDNTREGYISWLIEYNWEIFLTTRITPGFPIALAHKQLVADIIRPMAKHLKTQLAAITVIVEKGDDNKPHLHSLVLSKNKSLTTKLAEVDLLLHQTKSALNTHSRAIVVLPYMIERHAPYTAKNILIAGSDIQYYNKMLLDQENTKELNP